MSKRVLIVAPDLLFRAKLRTVVSTAGGVVVRESEACDLAVVAAEAPGAVDRIRGLVAAGTPVLAFASHVLAQLLRDARDAGAVAVPNSEVERRLAALVTSAPPAPGSGAGGPARPSGD